MALRGKIIVVTGGAGLLGRRFCEAIAAADGIPIVADIDVAASREAAAAIEEKFGRRRSGSVHLDITSLDSITGAIASVEQEFGKIDGVVNNAYPRTASYGKKFETVRYEDFCESVSLHLGGYFLVMQRFAEFFAAHGGGTIVNLGSIYGVVPPRFELYEDTPMTMPVEYAAIKSGILHLTKYVARYYKGKNVRVNAVSPGGIRDKQPEAFLERYAGFTLNKGMLDAGDITGTLVFLLSDESQFINGQNIVVDDGFSL